MHNVCSVNFNIFGTDKDINVNNLDSAACCLHQLRLSSRPRRFYLLLHCYGYNGVEPDVRLCFEQAFARIRTPKRSDSDGFPAILAPFNKQDVHPQDRLAIAAYAAALEPDRAENSYYRLKDLLPFFGRHRHLNDGFNHGHSP
jgi:hypothetical protein